MDINTSQGDPIKTQTDFRIISSTDYDISKSIDQVKLIPGLLQVINSNHIHIPALRERPEDIKPLTLHFVELFSMEFKKQNIGISDEVLTVLTKYSFPGNVRELRNIVERAVILCTNDTIRLKELPFS